MKKIFNVAAYALALNFLAVIGLLGWLAKSGHLDRSRITAIKALVFPAPTAQESPPTTQPSDAPTTQPAMTLEDLLKKASGRSAEEQIDFIQHAFDARMAALDLRERQIDDLQRQVDFGQKKIADEQGKIASQKAQLTKMQQDASKLATDQGFQDTLQLYTVMPPKQVKTIFMTLKDETIAQYLQAMQPKAASRIIKEFSRPDETDRIQKVLERMRTASTEPSDAGQASTAGQ